jgi:uncharacterized protein DUF6527
MIAKLNHVFIETIPDELEDGILYISIRFRIIMHNCACGCKNKVVIPLSPARWKMTFDGKTISLSPSIGNWNFDCRSHYWITNSEVIWAEKWLNKEITTGKKNEKRKRKKYYKKQNKKVDRGFLNTFKKLFY